MVANSCGCVLLITVSYHIEAGQFVIATLRLKIPPLGLCPSSSSTICCLDTPTISSTTAGGLGRTVSGAANFLAPCPHCQMVCFERPEYMSAHTRALAHVQHLVVVFPFDHVVFWRIVSHTPLVGSNDSLIKVASLRMSAGKALSRRYAQKPSSSAIGCSLVPLNRSTTPSRRF